MTSNASLSTAQQSFDQRKQLLLPIISDLYQKIYGNHESEKEAWNKLLNSIDQAFNNRRTELQERDLKKQKQLEGKWFLSNQLVGMSLYVDRMAGNLKGIQQRLYYFEDLGVNLLHLMPLFKSPAAASDGGYAVSDFREIDERFGTLDDLLELQQNMQSKDMFLMLDIVINHTSNQHQWAQQAMAGDPSYQDYYYCYNTRTIPEKFEETMPEVFPEAAPGNFTFIPEMKKWVMTVFHDYQWDLNYTNPRVLVEMIDTIFFYANIGVDILRIDAPAFIWKRLGTNCQNLPEAHLILQLVKACVQLSTPGMAILGEAIVAPREILKYFGEGLAATHECDLAYNATLMALQWDALASSNVEVLLKAQELLQQKPLGTTWITYTRCHDDIGLAYEDAMISNAGFNPSEHRQFIMNFYTGAYPGSTATGALFAWNEKTGDARISGSLAALCGLQAAVTKNNQNDISIAIQKIVLMQAMSMFVGGIPMLFYGDEAGYLVDLNYLEDPGKCYDNRWMHRPIIDWEKNEQIHSPQSVEGQIFSATQRLIAFRKQWPVFADNAPLYWIITHNKHVAGFVRTHKQGHFMCLFNFSPYKQWATIAELKAPATAAVYYTELWSGAQWHINESASYALEPYQFVILTQSTIA